MEKEIQKDCITWLRYSGWYVIENYKNCGYLAGVSDVTIIKRGRVVWVEFKSKKGKQREKQKIFESNIKTHGGEYVVIRELTELMDYLQVDYQEVLL